MPTRARSLVGGSGFLVIGPQTIEAESAAPSPTKQGSRRLATHAISPEAADGRVAGATIPAPSWAAIAHSFTGLTLVHSPYGAGYDCKQVEAQT
jgi:hypothetical protein